MLVRNSGKNLTANCRESLNSCPLDERRMEQKGVMRRQFVITWLDTLMRKAVGFSRTAEILVHACFKTDFL